jgi:hypothetical protein
MQLKKVSPQICIEQDFSFNYILDNTTFCAAVQHGEYSTLKTAHQEIYFYIFFYKSLNRWLKICIVGNPPHLIGPCMGDGGSGFYVRERTAGGEDRWVLTGVVSVTSMPLFHDHYCDHVKYVVLVDVQKLSDWIAQEVSVDKSKCSSGERSPHLS